MTLCLCLQSSWAGVDEESGDDSGLLVTLLCLQSVLFKG